MDAPRGSNTPPPLPTRSKPTSTVRTSSGAKPWLGVGQAQNSRPQGGAHAQNARSRRPTHDQLPAPPRADSSGPAATDTASGSAPGAADIVQALEIFKLFQGSRRASRTLAFSAQRRAVQATRSPAFPVAITTGGRGWSTASFNGIDHAFAHGQGDLPGWTSTKGASQPPALPSRHPHQAAKLKAQKISARRARPATPFILAPREAECKTNPEEHTEIGRCDERTHQDEPEALQAQPARSSSDSTPGARGTIPDHQCERSSKRPRLHASFGNGGPPLEWPVAWTGIDESPRPPQPRGPGHSDDNALR